MGKRINREKYANKIIQEFVDKGYDLQKAFGTRGSVNSVTKSESKFNEFKRKVRETRSYYKERETIKKEREAYKERVSQNTEELKKKALVQIYGKEGINNGTIKQIWSKQGQYGLSTLSDFKSKSKIQNAIVSEFKSIFEDEISESDDGNKTGALFKYHAQERWVEGNLQELYNLAKSDLNAVKNLNETYNYIYEKIIPLKYHGVSEAGPVPEEYSKVKRADRRFWEDVSKKVLEHYKSLNIRNK